MRRVCAARTVSGISMATVTDSGKEMKAGVSVGERDLYAHLVEHVQRETTLLTEYSEAVEGTSSRALAYLLALLIEDEKRHHRMMAEFAASLKAEAELGVEDPPVPRMDFDRENRAAVVELTERLLQNEKDDARELKRLRKEIRDFENTTLWVLLVELMQRDTDKHIALLRFVGRHT